MPDHLLLRQGGDGGGKKRLTGERRVWLDIAALQGKSPSEAMEHNSCTDMADTLQWMHEKWNDPDVICHYLAAIRYEIHMLPYRIFGSDNKVMPKPKDVMLKFTFSDKKPAAEESETDIGAKMEAGVQKIMRLIKDEKVKPKPPPKRRPRKRKG